MSTYDLFGVPVQVSAPLVLIAAALALAPYLGGVELGSLKIPKFDEATTKKLKGWCWIPVLVLIALYYPAHAKESAPPAAFGVEVKFRGVDAQAIDCQQLTAVTVLLTPSQSPSIRTTIDANCVASFPAIPIAHQNQDAVLAIEGAPRYVLGDAGHRTLKPDAPLEATLVDVDQAPRVRIAVLPSVVGAVEPQLQQLQEALADKIVNVSQDFAGKGAAYTYLTQLKVSNEGPLTPSLQEMHDFWKSRHALELVRGQVGAGAQSQTVHAVVYLGELAPKSGRSAVRLELDITPAQFARARDSYSVLTLYALARDAQRLKRPDDVVIALLSAARLTAGQIENPEPELAEIIAAISQALDLLVPGAQQ